MSGISLPALIWYGRTYSPLNVMCVCQCASICVCNDSQHVILVLHFRDAIMTRFWQCANLPWALSKLARGVFDDCRSRRRGSLRRHCYRPADSAPMLSFQPSPSQAPALCPTSPFSRISWSSIFFIKASSYKICAVLPGKLLSFWFCDLDLDLDRYLPGRPSSLANYAQEASLPSQY